MSEQTETNVFDYDINWNEFRLKDTTIRKCKFSDIRHIFKKYHYKADHMGGSISMCYAFMYFGTIIGGAVYGPPRHEKAYSSRTIDLRRFALVDESPKNSESYFLSKTLNDIERNGLADSVLTFADETQGHFGTIYKACNFSYIGTVNPDSHIEWNGRQYHNRSLTIDRPYSKRLKEALKNGDAVIVKGLVKHKYLYTFSDKKRSVKQKISKESND